MPCSGRVGAFSRHVFVADGSEVPVFYDSLLAKIIAWGPTREIAAQRLAAALAATEVDPLPTNVPLLRAIIDDPDFRRGDLSTRFLEERDLASVPRAAGDDALALAAAGIALGGGAWRPAGMGIPIAFDAGERPVAAYAAIAGDQIALTGDLVGTFAFAASGTTVTLRAEDRRMPKPPVARSPPGSSSHRCRGRSLALPPFPVQRWKSTRCWSFWRR